MKDKDLIAGLEKIIKKKDIVIEAQNTTIKYQDTIIKELEKTINWIST